MTKMYCFDTSGISNPLEVMPEDIHESMWAKVMEVIAAGKIAVTTEIYQELTHIPGAVGECIKTNKANLVLEVSQGAWDWSQYAQHVAEMNVTHHKFISEYCGGSPRTVCLNDMSIVALAKTLKLPLVNMEASAQPSVEKRRIPDVCVLEGVQPLTFSQFLREAKIKI